MNSRLVLARAVTIATRYLTIRRQFRDTDDSGAPEEKQVLDYSTVQVRILPLLATTFALHYSGMAMWDLYLRTRGDGSREGDEAMLAELHSTSAGLKSMATDLSANGIETCRRAMGGHGFGYSGLMQINQDWLSKPTVEGDNWMITQQVARYLIKKVKERAEGNARISSPTEKNLDYFWKNRSGQPRLSVLSSDADVVEAFNWRASWMVHISLLIRPPTDCDRRTKHMKLARSRNGPGIVSSFPSIN
jgi:acyl-CoA oxidase